MQNNTKYIGKADTAFINGHIYTSGKNGSINQALAIQDGKFVFVGSNNEAQSWIDRETKVIDLDERTVLPSFFEAHGHAQAMAQFMFSLDMTESESLRDCTDMVSVFISEHPDYQCITGKGWSNTFFSPTGPKKEDLDAISKDIPIALWSVDHHSLWVNSKALDMANITKNTKNPVGGVIEKNERGEPSGTLREGAADLVMNTIPDYTVEQYKAGIMEYQAMANALGFTGSFDAMLTEGGNAIKAYKELAENGGLHMYFRGVYAYNAEKDLEQISAYNEARKADNVGELFQINTIKFFEDGVVEGGTAYLLEPYADGAKKPKGHRGEPIWEKQNLGRIFNELEKNHFQIHVHSIGDAATREVLDAFEYVYNQNGISDNRHAVTHLQLVNDNDISRFAKLGIIAVANPYWFMKDDYFFNLQVPYLGKERAEREYPLNSFIKRGVMVASASDFPVTDPPNPLVGIQIGTTRITPDFLLSLVCSDQGDPKFKEPLWAEESVGLREMIDSFTYNAAFAHFLEKETGSIEVGKSADMVILNDNIFNIPETEICNLKVQATFFKGEIVYRDELFIEC
ncbi:MAG TPA: amidohydrolase [Petrimonas sp.]|nr:amidohydrolase [Petrimonas sp.]